MAGKETQQFCVRWNSYQSNLQSAFPKLLSCEHFVDVTLACESRMVKCHKVVLSACSAYFEKLLVQNPCQHPIIFMKDMKFWEVQALVDFMYKGEVNVTQDELATLLKAAEALEVRGLCGQQEGLAEKLSLPRPSDSSAPANAGTGEPTLKARRVEAVVKEEQPSSASDSAHSTSQNPPTPDHMSRPQSSLSVANVKQESRFSDNGGLFDDFDDDFYQDDNSLQIDETGSAYSLPGPSTQLDSSPGSECLSYYSNRPVGGNSCGDAEDRLWNPTFDLSMLINGGQLTSNKWRRDHRIYDLATQDLLSGNSLIAVATKYNIPRSTLHDYLKKCGLIPAWRKSRQAVSLYARSKNCSSAVKNNIRIAPASTAVRTRQPRNVRKEKTANRANSNDLLDDSAPPNPPPGSTTSDPKDDSVPPKCTQSPDNSNVPLFVSQLYRGMNPSEPAESPDPDLKTQILNLMYKPDDPEPRPTPADLTSRTCSDDSIVRVKQETIDLGCEPLPPERIKQEIIDELSDTSS